MPPIRPELYPILKKNSKLDLDNKRYIFNNNPIIRLHDDFRSSFMGLLCNSQLAQTAGHPKQNLSNHRKRTIKRNTTSTFSNYELRSQENFPGRHQVPCLHGTHLRQSFLVPGFVGWNQRVLVRAPRSPGSRH